MTSDGIANADWQRVAERAHAVIEASTIHDETLVQHRTQELFDVLDELEEQYGRLPSLTATRADFTDDCPEKLRLLRQAYDDATTRGDGTNLLYISTSLAEHFMDDDSPDRDRGQEWLDAMHMHLAFGGESDHAIYAELRRRLEEL